MSIYLRALENEDYLILYKWRNDFELTDSLGGNRYYVSKNREKKWLEEVLQNDKINLRLGICKIDDDKLIGIVSLTKIDHLNKKAEFSIMIGDKSQQGKGYGKIATEFIIRHGFEELNLNKIWLYVLERNARAIKLYEKIGFKKEGILRKDVYKNNSYHNVVIMSLLKEEYNNDK